MYSPADWPSRRRAAPAKKRRLSAENGISSREAISGLPTFSDSSCASSSAFSSITSASLWSSSERSFGVLSSHSGSTFFAAATARSTSSAPQRGTSAITSPVAGAITSIVSPETLSANSPPMNALYAVFVALMSCLLRGHARRRAAADDPGVARQPLRERDGKHRQHDDDERDDVDDGQLLALSQVVEDEDRKRLLRACRKGCHNDLVERKREREQPARDERDRQYRPDDVPERLPAVGAEVARRLEQRGRRTAQARHDVVVDDDDAERCVPDHDRPHREAEACEDVERVQRHAGDDPGQRDRQDEQERDRLAAEEAEARDRRGGHRPEHERDAGRRRADLDRQQERIPRVGVVPRDAEPVQRPAGDRPALDVRLVERVDRDDHERDPEEEDHERRPDAEPETGRPRLHQSASNAPRRRAISR